MGMKRRLKLDASQQEMQRSERKHEFNEMPNGARMRVVPPRIPKSPRTQRQTSGERQVSSAMVDIQRRSSADLVAALSPSQDDMHHARSPKYMLGQEVRDGNKLTRRGAHACLKSAVNETRTPAGTPRTQVAEPSRSAANATANFRDHRNSDGVQASLEESHTAQSPPLRSSQQTVVDPLFPSTPRIPIQRPSTDVAPTAASHAERRPVTVGVEVLAIASKSSCPVQTVTTPRVLVGGNCTPRSSQSQQHAIGRPCGVAAQNHFVSYGGISSLPSSTSKDSGYVEAGLTVTRHVARTPGAFSPFAPRLPVAYVLSPQS